MTFNRVFPCDDDDDAMDYLPTELPAYLRKSSPCCASLSLRQLLTLRLTEVCLRPCHGHLLTDARAHTHVTTRYGVVCRLSVSTETFSWFHGLALAALPDANPRLR